MSAGFPVHDRANLPPPRLEEVAAGLFAYVQPDGSWWINNTGFIVGDDHVLSIDTCATERRTLAYLDVVERVAGRQPKMLLNTHHHGDHTNGNCFLPWATIIGHERCREEIIRTGIIDPVGFIEPVEWGALTAAPPFVTFQHRLTVWVGGRPVELHHVNTAAHTTNDVVAWVPDVRVLYTGDLVFNGGTPFVLMGSVAGALEALDRVMEFDAAVIVPGHGPVCTPAEVATVGAYLRFVQRLAEEGYRAGESPLEVARAAELGDFAALTDPERLVGNLHRAYAECAGARPGDPIDLDVAFSDMITFNEGRPLRCLA